MNHHLALLLAMVPAASSFAQGSPQQLADAELPSLLRLYEDLHAHP